MARLQSQVGSVGVNTTHTHTSTRTPTHKSMWSEEAQTHFFASIALDRACACTFKCICFCVSVCAHLWEYVRRDTQLSYSHLTGPAVSQQRSEIELVVTQLKVVLTFKRKSCDVFQTFGDKNLLDVLFLSSSKQEHV